MGGVIYRGWGGIYRGVFIGGGIYRRWDGGREHLRESIGNVYWTHLVDSREEWKEEKDWGDV